MPMRKTGRDDIDRTEDRPFTKDPSRMVAISDGVFAVALTLLILDVKPPTVGPTLLARALFSSSRFRWPRTPSRLLANGRRTLPLSTLSPSVTKVVIFGATGMVGKGVLLECLEDARVDVLP